MNFTPFLRDGKSLGLKDGTVLFKKKKKIYNTNCRFECFTRRT